MERTRAKSKREHRPVTLVLLVVTVLIFLSFPASSYGQEVIQLSQPGLNGVGRWRVSADGKHMVYLQQGALWSVSTRGGTSARLSSVLLHPLSDFHITSNSRTVVYTATDILGDLRPYSIDIAGPVGSEVALGSGNDAIIIGLRPQTDEVIYKETSGGDFRRFRVPVDGPVSARIELPIGPVTGFFGVDKLSPDARYLVSNSTTVLLESVDLDQSSPLAQSLKPATFQVQGGSTACDSGPVVVFSLPLCFLG